MKPSPTYKATSIVIKMLQKIFGTSIVVEGIKDVPDKQVMFVSNHFTRFETFVLPYIIHLHKNYSVRSLSHSGFFKGLFGTYLSALGAIAENDPMRNKIIIRDLMEAKSNWLIYPEGMLVKNKKIYKKGKFILESPEYKGFPHTGAALLALKAQLKKREMLVKKEKTVSLQEDLAKASIKIVPVYISYYPIRPEDNYIKSLAQKLVKKLPARLEEELQVEGSLLLKSNIHIHFQKPIDVWKFTEKRTKVLRNLFFLPLKIRRGLMYQKIRFSLTRFYMKRLYEGMDINMDHLFLALIKMGKKSVTIEHLKKMIILLYLMIKNEEKYSAHLLLKKEIAFLLENQKSKAFDSILNLALSENLVKKKESILLIDKTKLVEKVAFHQIRLVNVCQVIFNELMPLRYFFKYIQKIPFKSYDQTLKKISYEIRRFDEKEYEKDYQKTYQKKISKPKEIGSPFFLKGSKKTGVVLSHGYGASPGEVLNLAKYLHKQKGYSVYGVRLKGHGTVAENMLEVSWKDWYNNYQKGYQIIKHYCSEVVLMGFSTGGVLAMLSASKIKDNIKKVVSINAPIVLMNKKNQLVPAISWWNDLMDKFNLKNIKYEYINTNPEYPITNYSKNYIKGVLQLRLLIEKCTRSLKKIKTPILIIQSNEDPVVDPKSARIILDKIGALSKEFYEFYSKRHVIIRGKHSLDIFEKIADFI